MNSKDMDKGSGSVIHDALPQDAFRLPQLPVLSSDIEGAQKQSIISVCTRPEIQPLAKSVAFKVQKDIETPFQVPTGDQILLNPLILGHHSLATLFIRYALELALWYRSANTQATLGFFLSIGILACHTARLYWETIIEHERILCRKHVPEELSQYLKEIENWEWASLISHKSDDDLCALAGDLLEFQDMNNVSNYILSEHDIQEARHFVSQGLIVASPLEYLLTTGGDDRLKIDENTGLNKYGCSPKPRPWAITFASTTASSVSDYAFMEAEKLRQRLIEAMCQDNFESQYLHEVERIRSKILTHFGLIDSGKSSAVLSTSGTDAELFVIFLALCYDEKTVVNILVGPEETGSGVLLAASGCHFAEKTPLGKIVTKGEAVNGFDINRVRLVEVPLRDYDGAYLKTEKIDNRVHTLVNKAIAGSSRILLHLVDSSKTGLLAPSVETVVQLKERYGDSLDVVVDACQLRAGNKKLKKYLNSGFMVIITGSKFFTGPPFSGALIIPANIVKRIAKIKSLPYGFSDYYSRYELPSEWSEASQLNQYKNVGLLLRWQAALWEIMAFQAVSDKHKYLICTLFGESIREVIAANPNLKLVQTPTTNRWKLPIDKEWDWLPTIFTFLMQRTGPEGREIPLSLKEAKKIYHWLNMDISASMPPEATEDEIQLAKNRSHIGQPVKISLSSGKWVGGLRISAGARLVSGICFDPELGRHFAERLSREIGDACKVLDKISLIIKYMNYIEKHAEESQGNYNADYPYVT